MSDEANRYFETARRIGNTHRFERLSPRELAQLNDKALAEWQANFSPNEAGWRLAEFEWQRRLTAEQIKAVRFSAFIGVGATLFAAIIGAILGSALTLHFANHPSSTRRGPEPHANASQQPDKASATSLETPVDHPGPPEAISSPEPQP